MLCWFSGTQLADWSGLKYPPMPWLQLGSQVGEHLIQWVSRVGWMLGTKWGVVQLGSGLLLARGCNDISEEEPQFVEKATIII